MESKTRRPTKVLVELSKELRQDSYYWDLILDDAEMLEVDSFKDSALRIKFCGGARWFTSMATTEFPLSSLNTLASPKAAGTSGEPLMATVCAFQRDNGRTFSGIDYKIWTWGCHGNGQPSVRHLLSLFYIRHRWR
jgi:hypothetical protein